MSEFTEPAHEPPVSGISETTGSHITNAVWPRSTNYKLAVAHEEMNPRRRNTMEDVHRIVHDLMGSSDDSVISYFGVYDGHGGRQIVDFLETALEENVALELRQTDDASVLERLTRAFLITDMQSRRLNITTAGATAVVTLISGPSTDRVLHVANVGDSRAVLVCEVQLPDSDSYAEPSKHGFFCKTANV